MEENEGCIVSEAPGSELAQLHKAKPVVVTEDTHGLQLIHFPRFIFLHRPSRFTDCL